MNKILLTLTLIYSFSFNSYANNQQLDKAIDLLGTSLEFIKEIEPVEDGPLLDAYLCVYTETFGEVMLSNLNDMMKRILNDVRNSSSVADFVFNLIEEDDPKFFNKLLADNVSDKSPIKKCIKEISFAKKQKYVDELTIQKMLSLAILTGINLGEGISPNE